MKHVIDVPGHEKLRFLVPRFLKLAKCVVFLIDATHWEPSSIRANAELREGTRVWFIE
jgi:signal recognition particle receptor subunit beta